VPCLYVGWLTDIGDKLETLTELAEE